MIRLKTARKAFTLLAFTTLLVPGLASALETSFEQDSTLPLVYINVAVKAGSVTDPKGQSGLTNFMGEMLLRGTRTRTKEQINTELDQMGARLSIETRAEAMIVRGAVLASQLEPFLRLLTDILTQPSFPDVEIRKLRAEIISGILAELGSDPSLASRRFTRFLFRDHPYGNPILGTTKDVEKISRDKISAQYERLIRDPNLLVVGAGDAKLDAIQNWAKHLASLRPGRPGDKIERVSAPQNPPKRRLMIIDKPDRTQTQINGGQIGVKMTDSRFFPLYLGNAAFGSGGFQSRLMVEIRVKRGWSYGANSYFRSGLQPRSWQFHLFPAAKDTPAALATTLQMVQDLKTKGITPEEFEFAQRSEVNRSGFMYDTPKKRVENKLLERTLDLPDGFMKSYGPELTKVKLENVNSALRDFLKPDQLTIAVLGTASELKDKLAQATGIPANEIEVVPYTQE